MPTVFHTQAELPLGEIFDTRDFCDANRGALLTSSRDRREAETFLEEVRKESYPQAPERVCSILTIPWARYQGEFLPRGKGAAFQRERLAVPKLPGLRCYFVTPLPGFKALTSSEEWVDELVDRWREIRGTFEKWEIANAYWDGMVRDGVSILIEGPVRIDEECPVAGFVRRSAV